mgnify:CR=1 FL=1
MPDCGRNVHHDVLDAREIDRACALVVTDAGEVHGAGADPQVKRTRVGGDVGRVGRRTLASQQGGKQEHMHSTVVSLFIGVGVGAIAGYAGPVRQICEILDYRYARYADQPGYVLHPFIDRGWARDLQLWVATSSAVAALEGGPQAAQAVVVLRVLPFASLLWIGLTLTSLGALWLALRPQPTHREVQR